MSSLPNPHCGDRAIELQQFTARPCQLLSLAQFTIFILTIYNLQLRVSDLQFTKSDSQSTTLNLQSALIKNMAEFNFEMAI